jgi:hypothetical protein
MTSSPTARPPGIGSASPGGLAYFFSPLYFSIARDVFLQPRMLFFSRGDFFLVADVFFQSRMMFFCAVHVFLCSACFFQSQINYSFFRRGLFYMRSYNRIVVDPYQIGPILIFYRAKNGHPDFADFEDSGQRGGAVGSTMQSRRW